MRHSTHENPPQSPQLDVRAPPLPYSVSGVAAKRVFQRHTGRRKIFDVARHHRRPVMQRRRGDHQIRPGVTNVGAQPSQDPRVLRAKFQNPVPKDQHGTIEPELQVLRECGTTPLLLLDAPFDLA